MYFSNATTSISTLLLISLLGFISYRLWSHKKVDRWGRQIAILSGFGLLLCCFAATRDNYHLSVQASMNTNIEPGLFTIDSIQSTLCCIAGAIIMFATLTSIFIKKQIYRKNMFFIISTAIIIKMLIIELSRIGV